VHSQNAAVPPPCGPCATHLVQLDLQQRERALLLLVRRQRHRRQCGLRMVRIVLMLWVARQQLA